MTAPALSVILVAPPDPARLQKTLHHLRAQTRASEIELVITSVDATRLQSSFSAWHAFHSVKFVPVESGTLHSEARARAAHASTAPIVAFGEDHVFPAPNWADALLTAHQNTYAAVSVEMHNANPSGISRADMLLGFGNWIAPAVRGEISMLPPHNTSYKREILLSYGIRLAEMLNSEAVMHQDLTRRKHKLFLETRASVQHLNIAMWSPFLKHKFWGGRLFGSIRADSEHWSISRRILYACGGGLIPLLRFWRLIPTLQRTRAVRTFHPAFIAALIVGLIVHAVGEVAGYLFGTGQALTHYSPIESNRADQLLLQERSLALE